MSELYRSIHAEKATSPTDLLCRALKACTSASGIREKGVVPGVPSAAGHEREEVAHEGTAVVGAVGDGEVAVEGGAEKRPVFVRVDGPAAVLVGDVEEHLGDADERGTGEEGTAAAYSSALTRPSPSVSRAAWSSRHQAAKAS